MNVSTHQGDLRIVHSETVFVYDNNPTTIVLDGNYTITLNYEDGNAESEQELSVNPSDAGVAIKLRNFTNPLGSATAKPIAFAKQHNKTLYLSFSVHSIGTTQMVHYTIYMGE